jgi:hypothetical protein
VFFETTDCQEPLPWVELRMPPNVTVTCFSRYSYQHGHKRPGYYRMRSWRTMTAEVRSGRGCDRCRRLGAARAAGAGAGGAGPVVERLDPRAEPA